MQTKEKYKKMTKKYPLRLSYINPLIVKNTTKSSQKETFKGRNTLFFDIKQLFFCFFLVQMKK